MTTWCPNKINNRLICFLATLLIAISGAAEAREALPLTDFYQTPESFPGSAKPGDLIRSMAFYDYNLPMGVRAKRILYVSQNSRAGLTLVSGVVLLPMGPTPPGGWPVIAWARGTSGIHRKCAPSLMTDNYADYTAPIVYAKIGYAVVATDYAGAGTDFPVDYMDRISNAWDIINAVRAAHVAVPGMGRSWIAVGHSAGAHAIRGVAELQASIGDPSYLGAVAASGLGNARIPMVGISQMDPVLAMFTSEAVKARYPDFDPSEIFTEKGLQLMPLALNFCQGPGVELPPGPPPQIKNAMQKNWDRNQFVNAYFAMDETGQEKHRGPILVLNGSLEPPPIIQNDKDTARRMCDQGIDVQFKLVAGANHFTLLMASIKEQLVWISDRFEGKASPNNCTSIGN